MDMLEHIVTVTLLPDADEAAVEEMEYQFRQIALSMPSVASLRCGRDRGLTAGSSDFAIIVGFESEAEFQAYTDDPRHAEISRLLRGLAESRSVVDIVDGG